VIASARNEWIRSTAKLVNETLDAMADDDDDQPDMASAAEDAGFSA